MTLLSVVRDVCAAVGVTLPQSVFSNITGNRTMQEMLSTANEMAQRIAYDQREWVALRATAGATGDGIKDAFAMPANYKRLLVTSNVWRSGNPSQPMRFISDHDEWVQRRMSNAVTSPGEWILSNSSLGLSMYIHPILDVGETTSFFYLDKNCVKLASGGYSDVFMADLDEFRLDERLLKLAMIYQWKAQKGSSYAEDMSTFGDALTVAMGHDAPAPILIDRKPISAHPKLVAHPHTIYVPGMVP